jgi:Methyltransferase domain
VHPAGGGARRDRGDRGADVNDLEKYFAGNTGRLIHKFNHYFEIYDRHFARFRGSDVHVVEFGVSQGGSLQMWKSYFGPRCRVFGVDINPECKRVEEERIEVLIGDQADRGFLRSLAQQLPRIDILIDDGGHTMKQQIATFEELFPRIAADGVYLCEDLITSYWPDYGGGLRRRGTFVEYSKNFIDYINAWHARQPRLGVSDFTRSAHSLHYYYMVLVIEKRPMEEPYGQQTGKAEIPMWAPPERPLRRFKKALKRWLARRT